jgi:hypothetical protein
MNACHSLFACRDESKAASMADTPFLHGVELRVLFLFDRDQPEDISLCR